MNRWRITSLLMLLAALASIGHLPAQNSSSGLVAELGCTSCHRGLGGETAIRAQAPDLSAAGLRYNSAYLFEFLRNPVKVRQHLGRARMPDFHLTEKEALALVAFLESQRNIPREWPELPPALQSSPAAGRQALSPAQLEAVRTETLVCLACHTLEGKGGNRAVEWANVGFRLQPDWVKRYLVDPRMFGVAATNMPALFYRLSDDGKRFEERAANPAEKIQLLADYLFSHHTEKRQALEQKFAEAKASFPQTSAASGEALFRALNCAACHRHHRFPPRVDEAAPDLAQEASRVTPTWLTNYLKHPSPIRPFGYRPGDGSRMPDFRLSDAEASEIASVLTAAVPTQPAAATTFRTRRLSVFAANKANALLTEKLSCLGCHRLAGQGGQIAPDLAQVRVRLQPGYVYGMISDPRAFNPHAIMPRIPMPPDTAELLVNFLLQQELPLRPTSCLSPLENPLIPFANDTTAATSRPSTADHYLTYCAACHGNEGRGNGFNARSLPRTPIAHSDAAYMSTRPDDSLYDAVASGGAIMNKSHFMPPWGGTLLPGEIKDLVTYMRRLCRCQEPGWASDGASRH